MDQQCRWSGENLVKQQYRSHQGACLLYLFLWGSGRASTCRPATILSPLPPSLTTPPVFPHHSAY
ncbi:hypothetical protein E2C01_070681 [Portunus trituberculatus]|uniref:Uncharacterized protein n=1 Tax=Portunus trituberculatus TaxID=210409 RepID=A0A5B7I1Z7_PORTR|nr:hypothetical protein [Portunus trituberculatus]